MGGGAPPILTEEGWLSLWHGVEPHEIVGIYRTYWSLLDRNDPGIVFRTGHTPVLEPSAELTRPLEHQLYLRDVVFTTGVVDCGSHFIVASGRSEEHTSEIQSLMRIAYDVFCLNKKKTYQ